MPSAARPTCSASQPRERAWRRSASAPPPSSCPGDSELFAVGTVIERYRIEAILGEGGMATVYRVRHEQLETLYALKVLGLDGSNVRERLLREGKVQASLRHPNIVEVRDVLDVNGAPGLLMEFIDGVAMDQWLEKHQPSAEEALTLFRGILAGVGHAHAEGFIHRDLKPANIMLQVKGEQLTPKIMDFGLAKLTVSPNDQRKTRTGSTMGTPSYMPPEQFSDASSVDRRADLYALGCVLYELFCGRKPFDEPKLLDMFAKIRVGQYPPPREINPNIPESVARAIEGLITVEPESRLTDCAAILTVLDGGNEEISGTTLARARPAQVDGNTSLLLTSPGGAIAAALAIEHRAATEAAGERVQSVAPSAAETVAYDPPAPRQPTLASTPPTPSGGGSGKLMFAVISLLFVALIVLAIVVPTTLFGMGWFFSGDPTGPTPVPVVTPPPVPTQPTPPTQPAEPTDVPEPTQPDPTQPTPGPEPSTQPDPQPVRPQPGPKPEPQAPDPAQPQPTEPGPTQPEPEQPEPVDPESTDQVGSFQIKGARSAMLTGSGKTYRPGQDVPPGTYTILATFDGSPKPTPAGKATIRAGSETVLNCKESYQRCSAK